jgi:hypothetical protein
MRTWPAGWGVAFVALGVFGWITWRAVERASVVVAPTTTGPASSAPTSSEPTFRGFYIRARQCASDRGVSAKRPSDVPGARTSSSSQPAATHDAHEGTRPFAGTGAAPVTSPGGGAGIAVGAVSPDDCAVHATRNDAITKEAAPRCRAREVVVAGIRASTRSRFHLFMPGRRYPSSFRSSR